MIDDTDHLDHSRPRWSWRGGRRPAAASAPCCPASSCGSPPPPPPAADTRKTVNIFLQIVSDKIFTWRCATLSWNWYQSALHSPSLRFLSWARAESSGERTASSSSSSSSEPKSSTSSLPTPGLSLELAAPSSLTLSAYLSVLRVCSHEDMLGPIMAIWRQGVISVKLRSG